MGVALLHNQKEAYIVLRNVLHTLRDRLPVNEAGCRPKQTGKPI